MREHRPAEDTMVTKYEKKPVPVYCSSCAKDDCYKHSYDFLLQGRVTLCRCPDPNKQHGKLKPRTEKADEKFHSRSEEKRIRTLRGDDNPLEPRTGQ